MILFFCCFIFRELIHRNPLSTTKIQAKNSYCTLLLYVHIKSSAVKKTIKDNKKSNLSKFSYTSELLMVLNFDTPFRRNQWFLTKRPKSRSWVIPTNNWYPSGFVHFCLIDCAWKDICKTNIICQNFMSIIVPRRSPEI